MFEKAKQTVKKYNLINKKEQIIIGVSGGADSMCLLYFLHSIAESYEIKLLVIHINHGLRGEEADSDEEYVKDVCERLGIPFFAYHISIADEAISRKMTEEEAGRAVRYEIFQNAAKEFNADKIAVAHTMNDNAETMLMNLCRGTGINGLTGISPVRDNIIRPLIAMSRQEVEKTLEELGIEYKTDYTNKSFKYTRNRVRYELIPWLTENMNSSVVNILSKNAAVINEENAFIENAALKAFNECVIEDEFTRLDLRRLDALEPVILKRVLRIACRKYNSQLHDISLEHIESIISLMKKQSGKKISLPNNLFVQKNQDSIIIYNQDKKFDGYCYPIKTDGVVYIGEINSYITISHSPTKEFKNCKNICTLELDCDKIKNEIFVRTRRIGDKIYLKGIKGYKKIKNLFIDLKIPSTKRDMIPLIADKNEIISIVGVRNSDLFVPNDGCKNVAYLQLWEENENEGNN